MSAKPTIHCKTCLSLLAAILSFFIYVDTAFADACHKVPQCQKQTKEKIHFKALQTRGWAFYCTGEYPYYWNNDNILGFGNNFDRSPSCFSVVEDPFEENHPSKADFTITNWCHESKFPWAPKSDDIKVTIGCSKVSSDLPSCSGGDYSDPEKDPGCPIKGKVTTYCSHGTVPACVQVWTEQCTDGKVYQCTKDSVFPTYCLKCESN